MLMFNIPMEALDNVMTTIRRIDDYVKMKCTKEWFSIILPSTPDRFFIASFQMAPQFFTRFTCNDLHHTIFSIDGLHTLMLNMQQQGFASITLSLSENSDRVVVSLEFHISGDEERLSIAILPTFEAFCEKDVEEIDFTYFVSIGIEEFRRVLKEFEHDDDEVSIVLTNSQIKFSVGMKFIILTTMRKECLIGGFAIGEEFQTSIKFDPIEFFYNFQSKRVWLFKSNDRGGIMLTAPMGLYSRISSYFPKDFDI